MYERDIEMTQIREADENRNITNAASAIITALMTALFAAVWLLFYNSIVFCTHQVLGAVCSILVWTVLYLMFSKTYRAFKIASCAIGETAFSQFLSIGFADLIMWVAGCLAARYYVNILPGAATVVVQVIVGFVWATKAKQYFLNHVQPRECLLLYEKNDEAANARSFAEKIENTYGHLFRITRRFPVGDDLTAVCNEIYRYPVVFIDTINLEKRQRVMKYCIDTGKQVYMTPTVQDVIARGYDVKHFIDTPTLGYNGGFKIKQTYVGKRTLDVIISLLMIVVTSPIMLVAAIAIKIEDHGKILFKQKRVGLNGRVFNILKFRSMVEDAEKDGKPRPCTVGDPRVTKVGKILRSTRADELPQLFNILKNDISLIGPRAERIEQQELYSKELPEFSYRLRVKAGLTGYAQAYGKYNTSPRDKLLMDLLYIEQQSFLTDLKIFFLTVKTVFTPEATEGFDDEKSKAINAKAADENIKETANV